MTSATLLASIFLVPVPFFLLFFFLVKQKKTRSSLPPGPKPLPIIGNLHQVGGSSDSFRHLSKQHGPLMFLQLGSVGTMVISSADAARDVLRAHDLTYSGRPSLYVANMVTYNGNGITFAAYGPAWRESRKVAIMELLSLKRVQSFHTVRAEEIDGLLNWISSTSGPVNLNKLALLLTNNIISRVTFGKKFESEEHGGSTRFDHVLHDIQDMFVEFNWADFFPWMKWINKFNGVDSRLDKLCGELDELLDEMIVEHLDPKRPQGQYEDMLDLLLRVQTDPNQQDIVNNQQLKGLLIDLFVAGTDTSAATIVWVMTHLIKNPSIMKRARDEIRTTIRGKQKVEEVDLHNLTYLKWAIKETLRLNPPGPLLVPRQTIGDSTIYGYKIPVGTRIIVDAISIGTDPKYWEDPDKFQPERFLGSSVDFRGQDFELIPFGVGRRSCPGMNFALVMVEIAVANMLAWFDWSLPSGMGIEDVDMEEAFGITSFKKTPLCLIASHVDLIKD